MNNSISNIADCNNIKSENYLNKTVFTAIRYGCYLSYTGKIPRLNKYINPQNIENIGHICGVMQASISLHEKIQDPVSSDSGAVIKAKKVVDVAEKTLVVAQMIAQTTKAIRPFIPVVAEYFIAESTVLAAESAFLAANAIINPISIALMVAPLAIEVVKQVKAKY